MCTKGPVPELYSCGADWKMSLRRAERKKFSLTDEYPRRARIVSLPQSGRRGPGIRAPPTGPGARDRRFLLRHLCVLRLESRSARARTLTHRMGHASMVVFGNHNAMNVVAKRIGGIRSRLRTRKLCFLPRMWRNKHLGQQRCIISGLFRVDYSSRHSPLRFGRPPVAAKDRLAQTARNVTTSRVRGRRMGSSLAPDYSSNREFYSVNRSISGRRSPCLPGAFAVHCCRRRCRR